MRTPDGRTFRPKTQADVNRANRKADDVLSRRLSRQPKIPEAATAGTMQGFTRATNSDFTVVGAEIRLHGWEFDDGWNADGNVGPALTLPSGALPTEQRFGAVEAGWYGVRCDFGCDVGGSIPSIRVDFMFGADGQGNASMMRTVAHRHDNKFVSSAWVGAIYVRAASTLTFPFGVEVFWPSVVDPSCTYAAAELDVWRLG